MASKPCTKHEDVGKMHVADNKPISRMKSDDLDTSPQSSDHVELNQKRITQIDQHDITARVKVQHVGFARRDVASPTL